MSLLKDTKIWIFVVFLVISVFAIGYNPTKSGLEISDVDINSDLYGKVSIGEKISSINEEPIKTQEDIDRWNQKLLSSQNPMVLRIVHGTTTEPISVDNNLGIEVKEVSKHKINLGTDLIGGTVVVLEPNFSKTPTDDREKITEEIITALETRTNVYGLKEFNFRSLKDLSGKIFIEIETTGTSEEDIKNVLERQGIFEAYVPQFAEDNLRFNGKIYQTIVGDEVSIQNRIVEINETIELDGIEFLLRNIENGTAQFDAKVYEGRDVKFVHTDSQNSYIQEILSGHQFVFSLVLSEEGTIRFADATRDLSETNPGHGSCSLSSPIVFYLDEIEVSTLTIGCSLRGDEVNTIQISGSRATEEEAENEMRRLQSILKSGSLPVELNVVRVDRVSPSLGSEFLKSSSLAIFVSIIVVSLIVFLRYRQWKITIPMIGMSVSETVLILGFSSMIGWTIDLASIAGIIAAVGTGIDDQIIIVDEQIRKGKSFRSVKDRLRRSFFIIFSAAGTTIAAMLPLAFSQLSIMRGFGITTIIGILIGIFITRPAFSRIIAKVVE